MDQSTDSQIWQADGQVATAVSHLYWVRQVADAVPLPQQLAPNYEMMLVVNLGPLITATLGEQLFTIRQAGLIGPLKRVLRYELPPGAELIALNFTLDGFYRLLGKLLSQLRTDNWLYSDVLLDNPLFDALWHQLRRTTDPDKRARQLFAYVLNQLAPTDPIAMSLLDTVPFFRQSSVDPVKAVAQVRQVSPRLIQQRFQNYLGYSAKELARFIRFRDVLHELMHQPAPVDWLDVVQRFGYHDQSHLIRDFQYFLGMTPRQFLRQVAAGSLCINQSGKFY